MDNGIIFSYSRTEAIEDGVLVDVTATAREMGFKHAVAMADRAWNSCVSWSDGDSERRGIVQDEKQRLRHVLERLLNVIRARAGKHDDRILFDVRCVPSDGVGNKVKTVSLHAICGPGDDREPVITICLLGED
jgi:hypothetical protein